MVGGAVATAGWGATWGAGVGCAAAAECAAPQPGAEQTWPWGGRGRAAGRGRASSAAFRSSAGHALARGHDAAAGAVRAGDEGTVPRAGRRRRGRGRALPQPRAPRPPAAATRAELDVAASRLQFLAAELRGVGAATAGRRRRQRAGAGRLSAKKCFNSVSNPESRRARNKHSKIEFVWFCFVLTVFWSVCRAAAPPRGTGCGAPAATGLHRSTLQSMPRPRPSSLPRSEEIPSTRSNLC